MISIVLEKGLPAAFEVDVQFDKQVEDETPTNGT
jgi:hypothetical protein